tara:strand:+ start:1433 stop:1726 length:294 start_codon:yes stop_codon:yes gene_type:complete
MQSKYTTKQLIKKYTNKTGFAWGVETVMDSLIRNTEYELDAWEGNFTLKRWHNEKPSSQEIREEYIRQQTIAECIEYFENTTIEGRIKKLIRKIFKN